jgi:flagellar hook-associated protein 1 FlgK
MIGGSALQASQLAENVVGHNIANANTTGYSDETANMAESTPYTPADGSTILQPGMIGTGVKVASITRATDAFTTAQLRDAYGQQSYNTAQQGTLNQVQSVFNEPSTTGLNNALGSFFQSFQDVANNPEDPGVRASVIQNGVALTQVFHNMSQQLTDVNNNLTTQISNDVGQLNTYGSQIANLNVQIRQALAQGQQPNDLMDQRDVLIDKVSKLGNVNVITQSSGMVNVSVGNTDLVVGTDSYTASMSTLSANGSLVAGELAGLSQAQTSVQTYQSNLDNLANQVVTAVNNVQYSGSDMYGNTGSGGSNPASPFFVTTGTSAGTISVNSALVSDPNKLAAAAAGTPGTPPPPGDGSNAANFAAISSTTIAGLGSKTPQQYYQAMVSSAGAAASAAKTALDNVTATVQQLTQQKDSVTGVSTDTEMLSMLKYQQAYQAAARYVSTANSMLGTLINGLFSGN